MKRSLPQCSLKARALRYLAQREHSPLELRRKLMRHVFTEMNESVETSADLATTSVDAVLTELLAQGHLCAERFTESRVRTRAPRFGNLRIQQEIKQHALELSEAVIQTLQTSELQRACQVWARKFASPPTSAADWAKQARFLRGRGFSHDVVREALQEADVAGQTPQTENAAFGG